MVRLLLIFVLLSIFYIACSSNSNSILSDTVIQDNISDNSSNGNGDSSNDNGSNNDDNSNNDNSNNQPDTPEDNKPIGGADSDEDNFVYSPPSDCSYNNNKKPITSILAGTNKGIYYSLDNGVTWSKSTMPIGLNSTWVHLPISAIILFSQPLVEIKMMRIN